VSVLSEVTKTLEGLSCEGWQRELALSLATGMDDAPNASLAKELKALMGELGAAKPERKGDVADELAAKRESRRRASGS